MSHLRQLARSFNGRMSYWYFVRTRGREFLQTVEPWLKIALGSSALTLYGGGTIRQSLWVLVGVIAASEVFMALWGIYDHRAGNMERQQALNNLQDPWKVEMQERAANIERELTALRQWATRSGA